MSTDEISAARDEAYRSLENARGLIRERAPAPEGVPRAYSDCRELFGGAGAYFDAASDAYGAGNSNLGDRFFLKGRMLLLLGEICMDLA